MNLLTKIIEGFFISLTVTTLTTICTTMLTTTFTMILTTVLSRHMQAQKLCLDHLSSMKKLNKSMLKYCSKHDNESRFYDFIEDFRTLVEKVDRDKKELLFHIKYLDELISKLKEIIKQYDFEEETNSEYSIKNTLKRISILLVESQKDSESLVSKSEDKLNNVVSIKALLGLVFGVFSKTLGLNKFSRSK